MSEDDEVEAPAWASSGYVISARVFGTTPHPISRREYDDLAHRADDLMAIIELEESYDVLIRNYLSLEKAHASTLVDFMVVRPRSRLDYERRRREADRQLVNLLASGEMYADHLSQILKRRQRAAKAASRPFPASAIKSVEREADEQRAKFLGVRALEAMRHHVLHLSLPVKGWNQNSAWVPYDGQDVIRITYTVGLRPALLGDVAKKDPSLVAKLEARADKNGRVAWLPLAREYVEGASYVHRTVRDALASLETDCLSAIDAAIGTYRAATSMPAETEGMMAVAKVGPGWNLGGVRAIDFDTGNRLTTCGRPTRHPSSISTGGSS